MDTICQRCGKCCMIQSLPPFWRPFNDLPVNEQPPEEAVEELQDYLDRLTAGKCGNVRDIAIGFAQLFHSPCLWFDQKRLRCRYYEFRPKACRDFAYTKWSREELDKTIDGLLGQVTEEGTTLEHSHYGMFSETRESFSEDST